jgi:hypothetical protein
VRLRSPERGRTTPSRRKRSFAWAGAALLLLVPSEREPGPSRAARSSRKGALRPAPLSGLAGSCLSRVRLAPDGVVAGAIVGYRRRAAWSRRPEC